MPTNGKYGPGRILRTGSPKGRSIRLWLVLVPLLLVPNLLTPPLAGTGLSAAGATVSTLITPGVAIGPVRLGMPVREVIAVLGGAGLSQGAQIRFLQWGITVDTENGVVVRIYTSNPLFRTIHGAGVGVSPAKATQLVGDKNIVLTNRGSYLTADYFLRGIGFVFDAGRAIAVFVKPPLTPGPRTVLGPSQAPTAYQPGLPGGVTPPGSGSSGAGGSSAAGTSPGGGAGGTGGGGGSAGGTGGSAGGTGGSAGGTGDGAGGTGDGAGGSGGGGDPSGPLAPIRSVSVDANGNLLVNGTPFLAIVGEVMSYDSWASAGYTLAQAEAKIRQMKAAGINTLLQNWGGTVDFPDQVQAAWDRLNLYEWGSATLDMTQGIDVQSTVQWGTPNGNAKMALIINAQKTHANILGWWITNEFDTDQATDQIYLQYESAARQIHALVPSVVMDENLALAALPWTIAVAPTRDQVGFAETILGWGSTSAVSVDHLWNDALRLGFYVQQPAHNPPLIDPHTPNVFGLSVTPLPELIPENRGFARIPTQTEVDRFFLLSVAMNVRAFSVLWAPNTRHLSIAPSNGDAGLPAGYLDTWNMVIRTLPKVVALKSVILAPARWTWVTTTPVFNGLKGGVWPIPQDVFSGIFASKKTVGGTTYVIAVNMNASFIGGNPVDQPVSSATIDVGQTIQTAARLFESGSVSFSGSVITDSFVPMGVHVYVVR